MTKQYEPQMPIEDIIKDLEVIKALVEWNYPLDYQISLDKAIEILKGVRDGRPGEKMDG